MSSTNEGSDDGAREDELDLGQQDEELPAHPDGDESHGTEDIDDMPSVKDRDLQDDSVDEGSSQLLPPVSKATDEASSIPDDTPSLHVSHAKLLFISICILTIPGFCAIIAKQQCPSLPSLFQNES
jgi:vacuolar protein sorting-associated protein 8